jgi:hypothetical protein
MVFHPLLALGIHDNKVSLRTFTHTREGSRAARDGFSWQNIGKYVIKIVTYLFRYVEAKTLGCFMSFFEASFRFSRQCEKTEDGRQREKAGKFM